MSRLVLFNKPYGVLSQFTPEGRWQGLRDVLPLSGVYAAGRLDADSEGLLILTDDGPLQSRIADPRHKLPKTYWAQVEGMPTDADLEPLRRGVSGRLRELKIVGTEGSVVVQKELPIRFLFGVLKSAAFVVTKKGSSWVFTGAGWGHGVGMCQWGARGMAEAGRTYRQILDHYFTDTYILNVYQLKRHHR